MGFNLLCFLKEWRYPIQIPDTYCLLAFCFKNQLHALTNIDCYITGEGCRAYSTEKERQFKTS